MQKIGSLFEIINQYRVVFFDAYGVLKNSQGLLDGVTHSINCLREQGVGYFVITNDASRSPSKLSETYKNDAGQQLVDNENMISSGMLARDFINSKVPRGRIAYLGSDSSEYFFNTDIHQPTPVKEIDEHTDITALALFDDEGFDWNLDLNKCVNILRKRSIPVIVANPDLTYPSGPEKTSIAIGALATVLEKTCGKTIIRFGKPDTEIFSYAFLRACKKFPNLLKSQILMIGDTLKTDILGANKFGIDTALVLSGNTLKGEYRKLVDTTGIIPNYILDQIGNNITGQT